MRNNLKISGFSDEISSDFDEQLKVVKNLGMNYISLRSIDGKGIGDFTVEEIEESVLPRLQKSMIGVSSIGSPIGKIFVNDEEGFEKQKNILETICKICNLLNCKYIRIFSFYIPKGDNPDKYKDEVVSKLKEFSAIAEKYNVVLMHENEKDIYGDILRRCKEVLKEVRSPNFKAVFDFANFVQCGEDPQNCYDELKDQIAYIHIKDAVSTDKHNVIAGTGEGKIAQILAQAIENGYSGFLTLEPHLTPFDSLKDLELDGAEDFVEDTGIEGKDGYRMQYEALLEILKNI